VGYYHFLEHSNNPCHLFSLCRYNSHLRTCRDRATVR
jgi:hypothetical protein